MWNKGIMEINLKSMAEAYFCPTYELWVLTHLSSD